MFSFRIAKEIRHARPVVEERPAITELINPHRLRTETEYAKVQPPGSFKERAKGWIERHEQGILFALGTAIMVEINAIGAIKNGMDLAEAVGFTVVYVVSSWVALIALSLGFSPRKENDGNSENGSAV